MSGWGALAAGIAGVARSGVESIEAGQKQEQAIAAEQRAADRQIDVAQRLEAAREAMKNRAAERYSAALKKNMQGGAPLEIAPGDPAPLTNEGMTTKRSFDEAVELTDQEMAQNDAPAYIAGQGMLGSVQKEKAQAKAMASKEKIEAAKLESRERTEASKAEQRDKAEQRRNELLIARIEKAGGGSGGKGGKGDSKTALRQNVEMLKELGYSPEKIESFIFDKKSVSEADIAAKILSGDKYGEMSPEEAAAKARKLVKALEPAQAAAPAAAPGKAPNASPAPKATGPAVKALPAGAKYIGTYQGKPAYQTPDGKKFFQE